MTIESTPSFVMAIQRGLAVLQAFEGGEEWLGNGEIAERARLPKSTVSRAAFTLAQAHFLDVDPASKKYRLGAGVLELAGKVTTFSSLRRVMRPFLESLAEESGGCVGAAFLTGGGMYYFEYVRPDTPVALSMSVGSVVPIRSTAAGRAYLAAANKEELARLHVSCSGVGDLSSLKDETRLALDQLSSFDFCKSYGAWNRHVNAIAVPYRVPGSGHLVALSVAGPSFLLSAAALDSSLSQKLKMCVAGIARVYGRGK